MAKLRLADHPLELLTGAVIDRLDLSHDQRALLDRIRSNGEIDRVAVYRIASLDLDHSAEVPATALDGLSLSLSASVDWWLDVGLFPEGAVVDRDELRLPWPDESIAAYQVPVGRVLCGIEMAAGLDAGAEARGGLSGISLGLAASGHAEVVLRFFKELGPSKPMARDAIVTTVRSFTTPFGAIAHPPGAGETLIASFSGGLEIGAHAGYGWTVEGAASYGEELAGVELTSRLHAEAQVGLDARVALRGEYDIVVRPGVTDPAWVNVALYKHRVEEAELGADVSVALELASDDRGIGAFVDGLLGRTPLPDLVADLRAFDPAAAVAEAREELKAATVDRVVAALRAGLEPIAVAADDLYAELREQVQVLVEAYAEVEGDVLRLAERAIDEALGLDRLDGIVAEIDAALTEEAVSESIRQLRAERPTADAVLGWIGRVLGDADPLETLVRRRLPDVRRLVSGYRARRGELDQRFESAYRAVTGELAISRTLERVRSTVDGWGETSVKELLDGKIVWLERHLVAELDFPFDALEEHADRVKDALERLVDGYDRTIAKARDALSDVLNRKLAVQASVAWERTRKNQTLASIDLDLAHEAGRVAYRALLRGDVASAMAARTTHADAVRFLKSYVLDEIARGFTFKTMINGRNRMTVHRLLLRDTAEIRATEDGEIYVQTVRVTDERVASSRRALITVQSMLEFAFTREFERRGRTLRAVDVRMDQSAISYAYAVERLRNPGIAALQRRLEAVRRATSHLFDDQRVWAAAGEALARVAEAGRLGDVAIHVDAHLSATVFRSVFDPRRDPAELRVAIEAAYDATRRALQPRRRTAAADFLELARGTTVDLLLDIHRELFVRENADALRPLIDRLGKKMKQLNVAGQFPGRTFVMSMFSHLAGPLDRGASLSVDYRHPVTGRPASLRFDEVPDRSRVTG